MNYHHYRMTNQLTVTSEDDWFDSIDAVDDDLDLHLRDGDVEDARAADEAAVTHMIAVFVLQLQSES